MNEHVSFSAPDQQRRRRLAGIFATWRLSPLAEDGTPQTGYRHVVMPAKLDTPGETA